MENNFMAKHDSFSIGRMEDLFGESDKYVYFIEKENTNEWLTEKHEWTKDPTKALLFKSQMKATTYAVENKIAQNFSCIWIITEHEFVEEKKS